MPNRSKTRRCGWTWLAASSMWQTQCTPFVSALTATMASRAGTILGVCVRVCACVCSRNSFQGGHHIVCACVRVYVCVCARNFVLAFHVGLDHHCSVTHKRTHAYNTSAGEPRDSIIVIFARSHEQVWCLRVYACACLCAYKLKLKPSAKPTRYNLTPKLSIQWLDRPSKHDECAARPFLCPRSSSDGHIDEKDRTGRAVDPMMI